MKIDKQHITNKRKLIGPMSPEWITIHSTGNKNSTAQNEKDNLNRPSNTSVTGFHYVVGDNAIIECIPPTTKAYHAGDGEDGTGNNKSIGIEMVESGDRNKVIQNTLELTRYLQKEYNIPNQKVVRHHDWSGKNCPRILNYNNWQGWVEFKTMLRSESNMNEEQIRKIVKEEMKPSTIKSGLHSWANPHFVNLNARGIEVKEKRFADVITRGEVMALLARVTDPETLLNLIEHAKKNVDK